MIKTKHVFWGKICKMKNVYRRKWKVPTILQPDFNQHYHVGGLLVFSSPGLLPASGPHACLLFPLLKSHTLSLSLSPLPAPPSSSLPYSFCE